MKLLLKQPHKIVINPRYLAGILLIKDFESNCEGIHPHFRKHK